MQKRIEQIFVLLVFTALFAPFMLYKDLIFPFVTSKAFYFRVIVEFALPLYVYLIVAEKKYRPDLKNPLTLSVGLFFLASLVSSFIGFNNVRSLFGNFERMGGTLYLAHLSVMYLYVLLLPKIFPQKQVWHFEAINVLLVFLAIFGFLKFAGLTFVLSAVVSAVICGISWGHMKFGGNYLKSLMYLSVFLALLTVINGIFNKLGLTLLYLDATLPDRVSSTFGNPIFFASFLVLPFAFSLFFAFTVKITWQKIYFYAAALLMLFGIYQSGTRGVVVGMAAAAVVSGALYFLFAGKKIKYKKHLLIGFAVLIAVILTGFVFPKALPEGNLRRIFSLNDANTQARLIQWKVALNIFKEKPILGVGPENYYIISDKYYNPKIYQYDASWFDKPHNYILEVLATGGLVGFLSYLAIICITIFSLYKGLKQGSLLTAEFCALLGGFIAYNIQNMFVFDTISASIMFFAFVGLAGSLSEGEQKVNIKASSQFSIPALAAGSLTLIAMGAVLVVYNFAPIKIARAIEYGNAISAFDYKASAKYFEQAITLPYNFDKIETGGRFSDFAVALVQNSVITAEPDFVKDQLKKAYDYQKSNTQQTGNYTLAWLKLANLKIISDLANNKELGPDDEEAIKKGLELAPNRYEMWQIFLQLRGYQQNWKDGAELAAKIVEINPYNNQLRLQSGLAYYLAGEKDKGAELALEAVKKGFAPKKAKDIFWAGNYFFTKKDYSKAIPIFEQTVKVEPDSLESFFLLAQCYAEVGEKEKAKVMAQTISRIDPSQKPVVDEFIKSLDNK